MAWSDKFKEVPDNIEGYTEIICTHTYHGIDTFFISSNDWQNVIQQLLTPYWVNHYLVIMRPMD